MLVYMCLRGMNGWERGELTNNMGNLGIGMLDCFIIWSGLILGTTKGNEYLFSMLLVVQP